MLILWPRFHDGKRFINIQHKNLKLKLNLVPLKHLILPLHDSFLNPHYRRFAYKKQSRTICIHKNLKYCANFQYDVFKPHKPYRIDEEDVRLQHIYYSCRPRAELFNFHGKAVGSSRVNLYSSISSGICALWGPLHGGANQKDRNAHEIRKII